MKEITLFEFIQISLLLGSLTYMIGVIFFTYLIRRTKLKMVQKILYSIVRFVCSVLLTMIFWTFWMFKLDIVFSFIFLPAFLAEVLSVIVFILIIKCWK